MADAEREKPAAGAADEPPTPEDLQQWRAVMPDRETACPADGKHPITAFPLMVVGVIATAAGNIAAASAVVGILALFIGCMQLSPVPINLVKVILALGRIGDIIIFITLAVFCFFAICLGNLVLLPKFVRLARNRNEGSVFLYGLVSAGVSAVALKATIVLLLEPKAPSIREIGLWHAVYWAWGVNMTDRVLTTIWVLLTTFLAATLAWAVAGDGRWCATCGGRAMRLVREVGLKYWLLRGVVSACEERDAERAASAAAERKSDPVGRAGRVALYVCPGCGRGLIEATATFEKEDQRASWLAASLPLSPAERETVEPILARGPAPQKWSKRKRK